ncbi:exopolysaccharide biosynthesis polyprenyl glycosylphosphotransferase [Blautia sp. MSJ-19]|uniref:exopolysaccharide biosynthesis polyprenyl glycosylphosphotransferase n=1 Tax=Blautia sp. MSJ-19 TaxID=2841517 RepID=UPI001C0EA21F|nr:exopolysaccharide biosynthesis polyprenyl glycosylphosphotransferase [Blautia sp. MSJ-19]MBU5480136.1 exopolysaccharide biosynthesis polyprenyl glycosylphosphotransferase [Blautia sp. MSJ-19]
MEEKQKTTKLFAHDIPLRIVKVLNIICITIPFACCWYGYYLKQMENSFYNKGNILMIALFMIVYFIFARIYNAFLVSINRISEMVYSQVLAALVTDGISYLVIALLVKGFPNLIPGILAIAGQIVLSFVWSFLAHHWYFRTFPPRKTMIVYDVREGMEKLINQYDMEQKFEVKEIVQVKDCLQNLEKLDEMETVFLSGIHSHERNVILKYCVEHQIRVYVIPRVGDVLMSGAKQMHMFHLPMLQIGRYSPQPEYLFFKRLADLIIAGAATIILSPIMIITAIAIKAYDRGPVFYSQVRLTKDGKEFGVLKFRSMKVNAEKDGVARLSSGENDPRITPVGHIIRKCRIDELPQLLNILKGDMTIVGPRPERPSIAAEYEKVMPEFRLRLQAKAGLTGYAQVYGKYNTTPYDKLLMDLTYISHPNLLDDIMIMFATVKILFMPESTEGVAEGQTTAMQETTGCDEEEK